MAGLIKDQMAPSSDVDDAMQQQPLQRQSPQQMEQQEAEAMNAQQQGQEPAGEGVDPESDPGYQQAAQFAMEALYKNKAAKDIAKALKTARDPVEALANTAYEIISITDERTNGAVPDEMLAAFATFVLEEVAEIAEAANVPLQPSDVAMALKQMILRFLGEQGVDTTQLQQAMDQVDPEEFNRMAEGEEPELEEMPA
jgi:hypothetical protein